jgi:isocitrate lyase
MKAYVEIIQRKERDLGTDVLTHQKVSWLIWNNNAKMLNALVFAVERCGLCG